MFLLSCERSMGKAPAALINVPKIGTLNNVCLEIIDCLPGKAACINIGSIRPDGCQAMNSSPPSSGKLSSSTRLISLNQTETKARVNLRVKR